jgi:hypothetical protein
MHLCNTKKALSPVMSSGILICIAIAVSLATLAWMNGLPNPDMQTEYLQVTSYRLGSNLSYVDVTLYNSGIQSVRIKSVTLNAQPAIVVYIAGSNQIDAGETAVLRVANAFAPKEIYQLEFQTVKGSKVVYTVKI